MRRFNMMVVVLFTALFFNSSSVWSLDRFVDLGDGSVLDTYQNIRWLKNMICFGPQTWDTATVMTSALAPGMCGLTGGSVAGDWRLPDLTFMVNQFALSYTPRGLIKSTFTGVDQLENLIELNPSGPLYFYFWSGKTYDGGGLIGYCNEFPCASYAYDVVFSFFENQQVSGSYLYHLKTTPEYFWPVADGHIGFIKSSLNSKDFGEVMPNTTSASQIFTISNNGTVAVFININLTGRDAGMFTLDKGDGSNGTCGNITTLASGASCTVSASFNPTKPGARAAFLWLNSTAVYPNVYIQLGGNTIDPDVSWWKGENDATDSAGGNNGTLHGGAYAPGKFGQAFSFDGSPAQYVAVPSSSTLDIFGTHSVAFWIKPATLPAVGNEYRIISKWTNGYEHKQVSIDSDGKVHYFLYGTTATSGVTSTTAVQAGTWTHVVATYDGANMKIYLNGVPDASITAAGDVGDGTGALYLGYNPDTSSAGGEALFNGLLDEVGWYNRTLSSAEAGILANMDVAPFSFASRTGMPLNDMIGSDPITVTGITGSTVISIFGGEYAISSDNGSTWSEWTKVSGTVSVNNQVKVRQMSSASYSTKTTATLTIGWVKGVFDVTTEAAGDPHVNGAGLVAWWQAENNALDTIGGNHGLVLSGNLSATVAENGTAKTSCDFGATIVSYTSLYGADPNWSSCGSCTTGSPSCSVTFNNTNCAPDPYPGHVKTGKLNIVCSSAAYPAGKVGQAFSFDGSMAQYITVPHSSAFDLATGHTVSLWVKLNSLPAAGKYFTLVNKWTVNAEDKRVAIDATGKVVYYLFGANGTGVQSSTPLAPGAWSHVVATYDGTAMKIYINGILDASTPASGNVGDGGGKLYFGLNPGRVSENIYNNYDSLLDEIKWYNRALSSAEISSMLPSYTLAVTVSGNGGGTITSAPQGANPIGITCTSGTCTTTFPFNTPVTLAATLNAITTFGSWGGDCSGSGACGFTMDTDKTVTATLIQAPLAKNTTCNKTYPTLADALTDTDRATFSGDELLLLGTSYDGAVSLNKGFVLNGGWNATYLGLSGLPTILNGDLTIQNGGSTAGSVDVKGKLVIQGGCLRANGVTVRQ